MEQNIKKWLILTTVISLVGAILISGLTNYAFYYFKGKSQLSAPTSVSNQQKIEKSASTYEQQIISVVNQAENSVVSIVATKDLPVIERYYINPFEGFGFPFDFEFQIPQYRQKGTRPQEVSAGSGFIVSSDGYIITNKHVVEDQEARYTVLTNDGRKYSAKVIARDPYEDVAVVKIEATNLKPLRLGDSSQLMLGSTVIAIGNALGEFKNTVSVGVISGLGRTITAGDSSGQEVLTDVIQTDAAINRGNSGGPLLNLKGEVIGINTAIVSGAENIGFAIPINRVKKSIESAITTGQIKVPYLGVSYLTINGGVQNEKKLPVDYGALVVKDENGEAVMKGSPAEKAGLKEGDIILEVNGVKVTPERTLSTLIREHAVGETIELKVLRGNQELTIAVTLAEREK